MPANTQIYISTIRRMYSILKDEDLNESAEKTPFSEYVTADSKAPKEAIYYSNLQKYWQQFGGHRRHITASSSLTGVSPPASSSLFCTTCTHLLCCHYF